MNEIIWEAIYNDGTLLPQYNDKNDPLSANKYIDIDRSKLVKFNLYKNDILIFSLHLDNSKKLIFRRRVVMKMYSGNKEVVYLIGWQEKVNNKNVQQISFIFEDGRIETTDGFKKGTKWKYPIRFLKEEEC